MNYLSIFIWVIICLFLPGTLLLYGPLSRYTGDPEKLTSGLFILPLCFSLSVAIVSVLGWLGYFLRLNFLFVERSLIAIIVLLLLVVLYIRILDSKAAQKNKNSRLYDTYFVHNNPILKLGNRLTKTATWQLGIWVLAISAGLLSAWAGPWMSQTADAFGHLSAIRSVILYNNPIPQEIFFPANVTAMSPVFGTWNLALSVVTDLAQADVILVWRFVNVLLAPVMLLAFASMAYTISRRFDVTFLSTLLYFVLFRMLDFRSLAYPNKMGQILMWLAIAFVIQYAQPSIENKSKHRRGIGFRENTSELLLIALLAFGTSAIHMQYGPTLILVIGISLVIAFIVQYGNFFSKWIQKLVIKQPVTAQQTANQSEKIPDELDHQDMSSKTSVRAFFKSLLNWHFLHSSIIAIIAALVPFAYKTMQMLSSPRVKLVEETSVSTDTTGVSNWLVTYENTLILVGILLIGLLLLWKKENYGSVILIAGIFSLPLFTIFSNTFIGKGGTLNTVVERLFSLVPAILYVGLGWLTVLNIELLRKYLITKQFSFRPFIPLLILLASLFYVVIMLKYPINLYSPTSIQKDRIAVSRQGDLSLVWADAITAIKALPINSILFSDLSTSYMLNGLTGMRVVSLLQQHTSLWDKDINDIGIFDVMNFTDGQLTAEAEINVLLKNQVTHVFLSKKESPALWKHVQTISALELIAEGNGWRLYRFNPDTVGQYLDFVYRKQVATNKYEIFKLYRDAENLFPNKTQYIEAASTDTDVPQSIMSDFLAKGDYYESPLALGTVYDFLNHINDLNRPSSFNPDYIHQTVFLLDTIPYGILFEHAPSEVSFNTYLPRNAWLQFSPVIAPEAWQSFRGDGVQFKIFVETSDHIKSVIYDSYWNPKNITSQRKLVDETVGLSRWSNQAVTITFATYCGPNNDCNYDWSGWVEPRIVQTIAYNFLIHYSGAKKNSLNSEDGMVELSTQTINNEARNIIFQHPSSQISYSVTLPNQPVLSFGIGMAEAVWSSKDGDGVQYSVYIRDPEKPQSLYRVFLKYIDPKNNPDDRRWFDEQVDLMEFGGKTVDIIFEALPGPANNYSYDWGGWSQPLLIDETLP